MKKNKNKMIKVNNNYLNFQILKMFLKKIRKRFKKAITI